MANEKLFHLGIKAIITNEHNQLLLLQVDESKLIENDLGAYWDIPGGRMKKGDSIEETLQKEILEETGIEAIIENPKLFHTNVANIEIPMNKGEFWVGLILFVYQVSIPNNPKITLSGEHITYEWVNFEEAAKRLATKYPTEFTVKIRDL